MSLLSLFVDTAHAQAPGVEEMWSSICETLPYCNVGRDAPAFFSQRLVNFIFPLIVGAAVCVIVYAGIKMVTAGEEGYGEAKTIITYAVIGIVLAILTKGIFDFVGGYLLPILFG